MVHWNPSPEIFRIGPFALRWYSLFFMISFLLGYYIFRWMFQKEKQPLKDLDALFVYIFVGTVLGARLGHCLFYDPAYYFSHPLEIIQIWKGGLASHGAAIGILTAIYLFARKYKKYPYIYLLDRTTLVVALAGGFIRLGNFFNSEIIGKPTKLPWGVVFSRIDLLPRHPAQIYESAAYFLIFLLLLVLYKKKYRTMKNGFLVGVFFFLVFTFRFFVEFLKADQSAFEAGWLLNMGQILSIPFILLGLWLLLRKKIN